MSQRDSEFWTRARRARDQLIDRLITHPDVIGIDIGYAPDRRPGRHPETEALVLRIHVRQRWVQAKPEERVAFPEQIDGIPVTVIVRDDQGAPGDQAEDDE